MILCSQCGSENPTEHRYCENCGVLLPLPQVDAAMAIGGEVLELHFAVSCRTGRDRPHNEDDFFAQVQQSHRMGKHTAVRSTAGLFVVCDGMGGHEGGEEASALAVQELARAFTAMETLPSAPELLQVLYHTNQCIYDHNEQQQRRDLARMGTTLAMLLSVGGQALLAHVGDSRIYQITADARGCRLHQCTRDHELANQLMDGGMAPSVALSRADAHLLTQALGPKHQQAIAPTIQSMALRESCLFLLCSDGLSDFDVIENHWQGYLLPLLHPDADLQEGLDAFMDLGDRLNGHDNLTAILVRYLVVPQPQLPTTEPQLLETSEGSEQVFWAEEFFSVGG
jgi:serine/threonine protein phosphatase PrpC